VVTGSAEMRNSRFRETGKSDDKKRKRKGKKYGVSYGYSR
jgi:hypothetical protein